MADPSPTSTFDAVESDGFVDYYRLLGASPDTTSDELQTRINSLYNEAQANRDHRNMGKRQQYQLMLELLPNARTILLNESKRAQYDEYLARHRAGEISGNHEEFIRQLASEDDTAQTDTTAILGVQEDQSRVTAAHEPRATVKTVPGKQARSTLPAKEPAAFSNVSDSIRGSFISVLVFFVFLIIFHLFIFGQDQFHLSVLVAATAGVITWWLTHYGSRNKTSL